MDITKKILNSINEGVFTIDDEWRITSFNKAAEEITGYSKSEIMGRYCREIFKSKSCGANCPMLKAIESNKMVEKGEMEIYNKNGEIVPIRVKNYPLKDEAGEVIGGIELFEDIRELKELRDKLDLGEEIIAKSKEMQQVMESLYYAAKVDSTILICGDTGVGKEVVANQIQKISNRHMEKFIKINCGAIPHTVIEAELFGYEKGAFTGANSSKKGYFELADKGTLFLDEIGELDMQMQVNLLRVLQEKEFYKIGGEKPIKTDVRIIAATNKNLLNEVKEGRFREDLYYRLNVFAIKIPPLHKRKEAIPIFVGEFIKKFNKKMGKNIKRASREYIDFLLKYDFPGNVRELQNIIEHSFIKSSDETLNLPDLPENLRWNQKTNFVTENRKEDKILPLEDLEREYILGVLDKVDGNKMKAARLLGIDVKKIYRRLKKWKNIPK